MRIGFDAKRVFHNFRGIGNYSRTLIEGLVEFYPSERYYLYSPTPKDKRGIEWYKSLNPDHVLLKTPKNLSGKLMPAMWRRFQLAGSLEKDWLNVFHGLSHELPIGIEKLDIGTVVTIHDLIFMKYPQFFSPIDRQIYYKKYVHAVKTADVIVAICEQTKNDLIELLGVDESKIQVIYQCCHPIYNQKISEDKKNNLLKNLQIDRPYILFVGALEENKNPKNTILAFKNSHASKEMKLVMRGSGKSKRNALLKYAEGIEDKIVFVDHLELEDLSHLYSGANFFIFPSFYEGFGLPIIEGLSAGITGITTQGNCFPEAGGEGCLYIDPTSVEQMRVAIDELYSSETLKSELVEKGKEFIKKFDRKVISKQWMDLYSSLM